MNNTQTNTLYFCTLFDINFVSYGVTMMESLARHCPNFHLYVFAFCDDSYRFLQTLNLPNVTILSLQELETYTPSLLTVKPTRERSAYCWTCTSVTILHCMEKFNLPHCCYLDADLYFYSNPQILFDELGDNSIFLTPHHYPPNETDREKTGKYCVQFMLFKNDTRGMKALTWWRDACLEWCHNEYEDGKFGDQKYLDDWTTRFEGVYVSQNWGAGIALWNISRYTFDLSQVPVTVTDIYDGTTHPVVFFHYANMKLFDDGTIMLKRYNAMGGFSKDVEKYFLRAYAQHLIATSQRLHALNSIIKQIRFSLRNLSNISCVIKKYRRHIFSIRFSKGRRRLCVFGIHFIKEKGL